MSQQRDGITYGYLAARYCRLRLPIKVLQSGAGYYIGTWNDGPCSRESQEYYPNKESAQSALTNNTFTQRESP